MRYGKNYDDEDEKMQAYVQITDELGVLSSEKRLLRDQARREILAFFANGSKDLEVTRENKPLVRVRRAEFKPFIFVQKKTDEGLWLPSEPPHDAEEIWSTLRNVFSSKLPLELSYADNFFEKGVYVNRYNFSLRCKILELKDDVNLSIELHKLACEWREKGYTRYGDKSFATPLKNYNEKLVIVVANLQRLIDCVSFV